MRGARAGSRAGRHGAVAVRRAGGPGLLRASGQMCEPEVGSASGQGWRYGGAPLAARGGGYPHTAHRSWIYYARIWRVFACFMQVGSKACCESAGGLRRPWRWRFKDGGGGTSMWLRVLVACSSDHDDGYSGWWAAARLAKSRRCRSGNDGSGLFPLLLPTAMPGRTPAAAPRARRAERRRPPPLYRFGVGDPL